MMMMMTMVFACRTAGSLGRVEMEWKHHPTSLLKQRPEITAPACQHARTLHRSDGHWYRLQPQHTPDGFLSRADFVSLNPTRGTGACSVSWARGLESLGKVKIFKPS